MLIYDVNKKSKLTYEEKSELINKADVGELLKVVREFEDSPRSFDSEIIKAVSTACFNNGIMLM